jgi:hypothetical protein
MRRALALLAACAALLCVPAASQEVRSIRPIERKQEPGRRLFPQAAPLAAPVAVAPARVEDAMQQLVWTWNQRELDRLLAADFRDRSRLLEVLDTRVPRRATLKLVAVQGWQVLEQAVIGGTLVTRLIITARTRVDFTDDAGTPQSREGVNDYTVALRDTLK